MPMLQVTLKVLASQANRGTAEGATQSLTDPDRLVDAGALEQDGEFVTAQTTHPVVAAHVHQEHAGNLAQQLVTGDMSTGIVDQLELVKIEKQECVVFAEGTRRLDCALQPDLDFATIDETGQRIVAGLIEHLVRKSASLRDVFDDAEDALLAADVAVDLDTVQRNHRVLPSSHRKRCSVGTRQQRPVDRLSSHADFMVPRSSPCTMSARYSSRHSPAGDGRGSGKSSRWLPECGHRVSS